MSIQEWQYQGLPTDSVRLHVQRDYLRVTVRSLYQVSINNAILVSKGRRWPLMIDPQQQANKWIRKMEEQNGLEITTMHNSNLLR